MEFRAKEIDDVIVESTIEPRNAALYNTIDTRVENLIVCNLSNQNIPVYATHGSNGAYPDVSGPQIGYIGVGEHYALRKRTDNLTFREVSINVGGSQVKRGYIRIQHGPWTGQSGYLSFMYNQVRYNSTRSDGDYVTVNGVTYARYVLLAAIPVYNQSGYYALTLPAGTHVLSGSSAAGETYLDRMPFTYKLSGNSWVPITNESYAWMDVISTGTTSSTKKIA